jgi:hypothetical protein
MKTIMNYFEDVIEYPDDIALEPIPMNILWSYISSTFLNGFINYVKPLKIYVLDRYSPDKTDEINNLKSQVHTDLGQFGDDIIMLCEIEPNKYMFFWFDMDVSDCSIGRFETSDSKNIVFESLKNWLDEQKKENEGKVFQEQYDNGILNYHELPVSFIEGWVSF